MSLEYSVVIRTLGKTGEKYQSLLDSINRQTIKPKEIIVVIPYGYDLPHERLGYETFVRSDKGMVVQRIVGAKMATCQYCLFVDDDLFFDENFVKKISEPVVANKASVTFPIFRDMLPCSLSIKIKTCILGSAVPFEINHSFTKVTRFGGTSYNPAKQFNGLYSAETAPGTCFFCLKGSFLSITFEDELWLEQSQYPLPEDQVMFYKFHLLGFKILGVAPLNFVHLDAGKNSPGRSGLCSFALGCNKTIFWHRFIWSPDKNYFSKSVSLMCYSYSVVASILYSFIKGMILLDFSNFTNYIKGFRQAIHYIHSKEYKNLPKVEKM